MGLEVRKESGLRLDLGEKEEEDQSQDAGLHGDNGGAGKVVPAYHGLVCFPVLQQVWGQLGVAL